MRLSWPEPVLNVRAGAPWEVMVTLSNTSKQTWRNVAADDAKVLGWVLDAAGHRVRASSHYGFGGCVNPLPSLRPGRHITLPVDIMTSDSQTLPAGGYALEAVVDDLQLHSEPVTLFIRVSQ